MITKEELNSLSSEFNQVQKELKEVLNRGDELSKNLEAFEEFKEISRKYQQKAAALTAALEELSREVEAQAE